MVSVGGIQSKTVAKLFLQVCLLWLPLEKGAPERKTTTTTACEDEVHSLFCGWICHCFNMDTLKKKVIGDF